MSTPEGDHEALQRRLERLSRALGPSARAGTAPATSVPAKHERATDPMQVIGGGGLAASVALIALAIALGQTPLLIVAVVLALASGGALLTAALNRSSSGSSAHIGMGADVAQDAIIEPGAAVQMGATVDSGAVIKPGATVEMGATVGPGAVIKRGAVVRMGATVNARAVLEEGAAVGWGSEIGEGAVVGRNAIVGAGSTVHADAQVPEGTRLLPGATWAKGVGARSGVVGSTKAPVAREAPALDPREARIHAACERIEAELRSAPDSVREYLGATAQTASALRATCMGLLQRERVLRSESSAESLAFLEQEKAELQKRIASASDERVRDSLRSAVAAIDDQHQQRMRLRTNADRLDAELTRMQWTLDGMATQLVRLRTAGVEAGPASNTEVLRTVEQLHDEIDAIAEALEHVSGMGGPELQPVVDVAGEPSQPHDRPRERQR